MQEEQEEGQGGGQPGKVGGGWQEGGEDVGEGVGKGPAETGHSPCPPHWQTVAARGHATLRQTPESSQFFHHTLSMSFWKKCPYFVLNVSFRNCPCSIGTFPAGCVHLAESN